MRWIVVAVVVVLFAGALVVALALEGAPLVARTTAPEPDQIGRVRDLLRNQRASRGPEGALSTVALRAEDVDLLLAYAARHVGLHGARLGPGDGRARIEGSLRVRLGPLDRWLNATAWLEQGSGLPEVRGLTVGHLPVPDTLTALAMRMATRWLESDPDRRATLEALQTVLFTPQHVVVVYAWRKDLPQRLRGALGSPADVQRLRPYQERLAAVVRAATGFQLSLATLLQPLCATALERGAAGREAEEFRALTVVLAAYTAGYRLERAIPDAAAWARVPPRLVTLAGRDDLAKHLAISMAIAANADTALADAVALFKELDDARHGSGFSFDDLAADRAGTRIGERGTGEHDRAMLVRCAAGLQEADVLPAVADLPHSLPEAEFLRRFGGVGAPAYQRVVDDIEARVSALGLLR